MKFFVVVIEIFGILFINYSESRVIKPSAQIYNDDSTSVEQQFGIATMINNLPGVNIGQQQNSDSAIFHNDAQTTVGKQIGPNEYFNNLPGSNIGEIQNGENDYDYNYEENSGSAIFHNDANTIVGEQVGPAEYFNNLPGSIIGQQATGLGKNPVQGIQSNPQMIMTTTNGVTTMTMIFDNGNTMTMQLPSNSQGTGGQTIINSNNGDTQLSSQDTGGQTILSGPLGSMSTNNGVTELGGPLETMITNNGIAGASQGIGSEPKQILSQEILPDGKFSQVLPSQQTTTFSNNNNEEKVSINSSLGTIATVNGVTTMTMNAPAAKNIAQLEI